MNILRAFKVFYRWLAAGSLRKLACQAVMIYENAPLRPEEKRVMATRALKKAAAKFSIPLSDSWANFLVEAAVQNCTKREPE